MWSVLDEHRVYLGDEVRLRAFRAAIDATVRPGDVVLDLGSGTAILGMLACRAGASRVYAVERSEIIEIGRENARANGLADRFVFVRGLSTRIEPLAEKADVVVADQLGPLGVDAGLWGYFSDARARHATASAAFIPRRVTIEIAPVEDEAAWERVRLWQDEPGGFDLGAVARWAENHPHSVWMPRGAVLTDRPLELPLDPSEAEPPRLTATGSFAATRAATLHGLGGWFRAELAPGVVVTSSPLADERIQRDAAFLPIPRPVRVARGETVTVSVTVRPQGDVVAWQVTVGGQTFRQSTFAGVPLAPETLSSTRPDRAPRLSNAGEVSRSILAMCDGKTTVREIEQRVIRDHPRTFSSADAVAAFVAEVLAAATQP